VTFRVGSFTSESLPYSPTLASQLPDFISKPNWHHLSIISIMCLGCRNHSALTVSFEAMQLECERVSSEKQVCRRNGSSQRRGSEANS